MSPKFTEIHQYTMLLNLHLEVTKIQLTTN